MSEPTVDVIVAVYNGADFIGEALSSIQSQTFENTKIIVVNDGSEDNTLSVVLEYAKADDRISIINQAHQGVQFALNLAIKETKSDFVAFLDADDLWHPRKLEQQLTYLTNGNFEICFCLLQEFEDSAIIPQLTKQRARTEAMKGYHKTACLARREVFSKYGLFNESVAIGDFVEWYSRVIRGNGLVGMVEDVLAYRRVHNNNTMINADKSLFLNILKKHLDELRNNGGE